MWPFKKREPEPPTQPYIHLAVDRNGVKYTEHAFGFEGDPWRGAKILTPSVIQRLEAEGLLPLTRIEVPERNQ